MECAAAAGGADDEPFFIGSLVAQDGEEVFAKARGRLEGGVGAGGGEVHFGDEAAVEEVEGAFVGVVVHVVDICVKGPVDGFGAEGGGAMLFEEGVDGPGLVGGPAFDGLGEDEGAVCPGGFEFFGGKVGEAGDLVAGGDVLCVGGEGDVGAVERSVEDV